MAHYPPRYRFGDLTLSAGQRLGAYEILSPLGAGGMGEVYRARDPVLGRDVAIKVLPEAFATDPQRLSRFEREARILASLNHPSIGAIYGLDRNGEVPFLVLELVPGQTLADQIVTGPLPLAEALNYARQIGEALEAAHELGIVHRDLKPANIKVTPEGRVKVLDFGLAKEAPGESSAPELTRSPTMTLHGTILGTAPYMSPEQARGQTLDKRTDIWSFGCVLYEMLTGRQPFPADTLPDQIMAILGREPDWDALPRQTPPGIRALLQRCLEKDAARRLRDIGEARIDLDNAISAAPATVVLGARRKRRIPLQALAIAVAAAALLAAAVLLAPRRRIADDLPAEKRLLFAPFVDLTGRPGGELFAAGVTEAVRAKLAGVSGIQLLAAPSGAASDPRRLAREVGANLVVSGTLQREADRVRITYSLLNAESRVVIRGGEVTGHASDVFGLEDRLAEDLAVSLRVSPAAPRRVPSGLETAREQEQYTRAIGLLQRYDKPAPVSEAIGLLEGLAAEKPGSALVQAALARAGLLQYRLTRDRSWVEKATAAAERARKIAPELPEVDATLGELALQTGQPERAATAFRGVLSRRPEDFDALLGLARALEDSGKLDEAEAAYSRAVRVAPGNWAAYNQLGGFYFARGSYAQAEPLFRKVTEIAPDSARGYSNLGAALHRMDRYEEAVANYRKSIAISPTSGAYSNAGTTEFYLGRYEEAAADFEKAVGLSPESYRSWANLADAYHWARREDRAKEAYENAIRLARGRLQVNSRDSAAHAVLAVCLVRTGAVAEARAQIEQALAGAEREPGVLYQAAIVAHAAGDRAQALARIRGAVEAGYGMRQVAREPEFADLRADDEFREVLRLGASKVRSGGKNKE